MEVAVISLSIPEKNGSLGGIFALDQAKALAEKGVNVKILAVDLRSFRHKRKWGLQKGTIDGISFLRYSFPLGRIPLSWRIFVGRKILSFLYKEAYQKDGKTNLDIIHAHFTEQGAIASSLAQKEKIPLVITEHSTAIMDDRMSRTFQKYAIEAYRSADKVIAVSEMLGERILKLSGVRPVIIYNIVDLSIFRLKNENSRNKVFNFITVSNLVPQKNHCLLLEAFSIFLKSGFYAELTIVGEGPERQRIQDIITRLGIDAQVKMIGFRKREELPLLFDYANCYVISSQTETFGVAGAEAMASGLPVLSTKCGGPECFIEERNGILVDNNNPQKLADGMIAIYKNIDKYDSRCIRQIVTDRFSRKQIGSEIIAIYNSIISRE